MPTAIFIMYTEEGFAFAADGLQTKDDGTPVNQETQKVFPVKSPGRHLAYALAGTVVIGDTGGTKPIFDFVSESAKAVELLATRKPFGLQRYSEELASMVNEGLAASMADAKANGVETEYPHYPAFTYENEEGSTIARLFVAGYYNNTPRWTSTRFFHIDQTLQEPAVETYPIIPGNSIGYGSKIVADLLYRTEDSRFSAYRINRRAKVEETTLLEAIELAIQTISAHTSPQAKEIDSVVCSLIGGRIHIGKITKLEGFQWVLPPMAIPLPNIQT